MSKDLIKKEDKLSWNSKAQAIPGFDAFWYDYNACIDEQSLAYTASQALLDAYLKDVPPVLVLRAAAVSNQWKKS